MRFALIALIALGTVGDVHAQNLPGDGFEVFAGLLNYHGVKPVEGDSITGNDIVIVFDPPNNFRARYGERLANRVLNMGGSALLASNQTTDWSLYLPSGTARTSGRHVRAPTRHSWDGDASRPLAAPNPELAELNFLGRRDKIDELFRNRARLAMDRPSEIFVRDPGDWLLGPFAYFPSGSHYDSGRRLDTRAVVAVGSTQEKGRLLLLADPDILSNDLLTAIDKNNLPADNLPFADALVTWLTADGERNRCHLIVNGELVTKYDTVRFDASPPLPPIPLPEIDPLAPRLQRAMTDLANESLAKAEADGGLDKLFKGDRSGQEPPRWLRALAIIGAVVVALILFRRLFAARPPATVPKTPAPPPAAPDLSLAARGYLASLVAEWGHEAVGPAPRLAGHVARTLTPGFRMVWGVASGTDAAPVTPRRWAELALHAAALRDAFAAGACHIRANT